MTEAAGPPPLLIFADDWARHPSSCQHLIGQLLGRHQVVWVNTIMRPPRLDRGTLRRGGEKLRQWLWPADRRAPAAANPRVLNPRMWPWFRSAFARRLNRRLLSWQLGPLVRSLPSPPVAVTTLPVVADVMDVLPVRRWVYYCVDDFSEWPGLDHESMRRMEEQVVARADVTIAVSETLQDKLARMGKPAHLLTHGVDLAFWSAGGAGDPAPAALADLPRPLVVFWGVLDRRMDVELVRRLASDLTAGTLVLVGPEVDADPELSRTERVVRLPPMPYDHLPTLAREAAVLVMPYADLPVTRAIQPLKLKEYLGTGKPTVVRDLPAVRPWADCMDVASTPEAFSQAVRVRLAEGLPEHQRLARQRLVGESWPEKARLFEAWALAEDACPERP